MNSVEQPTARGTTVPVGAANLARSAALLAGAALACGLLALLLSYALPIRYEAIGLVRVGQVAQMLDPGAGIQVRPVEDPGVASERLKTPSFLRDTKLGAPEELGFDLVRSVFVRRIREIDLLEVRYRAASPEAAAAGVENLVRVLRSRHEDLAEPGRRRLAEQLRMVRQLRSELGTRRDAVMRSLARGNTAPATYEYPFLHLGIVGQDNELVRWETSLNAANQAPLSTPTRLIEPVFTSRDPVRPNRVLLTVAGTLLGVLAGVAILMVPRLWRSSR